MEPHPSPKRPLYLTVKIADLAAAGKLALRVADTYPLDEAARAHARLEAGGLRGRLVLIL